MKYAKHKSLSFLPFLLSNLTGIHLVIVKLSVSRISDLIAALNSADLNQISFNYRPTSKMLSESHQCLHPAPCLYFGFRILYGDL